MTEREMFMAVLDLPHATARTEYLDEVCSDPARRARIEALLASHESAASFLVDPAVNHQVADGSVTQALDSGTTPNDAKEVADGSVTQALDSGATPKDANEADDDLNFLAKPRRPDSLGRIGHYEVLQVLGKGGFGIVFRAFDDILQRVVAVKVMAPQLAATSPARKRFLREARTAAAVRHENVVQVHEVAESPLPYIAMEFIPGETLQQRLDRTGPLDAAEVVRIGRQVAEGLAAAHANDLIHRDIKPGNILIEGGPQQRVKITDFGLARAADDASISQSGIIAGTPMYMAPEQALGQDIDQRADLFSLGSVLYQMAAGRPPFRANGTVAVLKRVAEDTPRSIRAIIPETPQWLCDIIAKLHAKNPDERFQSAREVADLLADCEGQLKTNSKLKDFSRIPRRKSQPSGRRKWVAVAAALLLPVIALAVTELIGVTQLFQGKTARDPIDPEIVARPVAANGTQEAEGWVQLFNGKDLTGWKPRKRNIWTVQNGILTGTSDAAYNQTLESDRADYSDFHLRATVAVNDGGVGGISFRISSERGYKAPINRTDHSQWKTGSLTARNRVDGNDKWRWPVMVGRDYGQSDWFTLEVIAIGNTIRVILDGKETARVTDETSARGLFELNLSKASTVVQFRKIEIKELPSAPVAPSEGLPPTFKNGIGMEFVKVPKGKSWLGGGKDKLGDKEVEIPADFYLGKNEVTQEEWEKVMGVNPSHFSRTGDGKDAVKDIPDADLKRFPVDNVSWDQCQIFVDKLNQLEKETGWVYRLPTEVEWEYACRGGPMADKADGAFYFYFARPTNTLLPDQANFSETELKRTCMVGSYPPNALGLYDLHGNVWEWCVDKHKSNTEVSARKILGACYLVGSVGCQTANCARDATSLRYSGLGLRLARVRSGAPSPEAKSAPLASAPFTDADVKRIAALPADEQVEEVRKELMRRNPNFDSKMDTKIEDGVVTEFRIVTDKVADIAPIRVFNALRVLECRGPGLGNDGKPNGQLADLTPLNGLNLAGLRHLDLREQPKVTDAGMVYFKGCTDLTHLSLGNTTVTDSGLAHFDNCKALTNLSLYQTRVGDAGLVHFQDRKDLTYLSLAGTAVSDAGLAHFKNCKNLTFLSLDHTQVSNAGLAHFEGIPLKSLWIDDSRIRDLTPLQGMPLEEIHLTPKNIVKGLDILRDMKSLKTIGIEWNQSWPATEFWERYDKGEFGAAPFTDAEGKRLAAMPAAKQVEEVRKELKKRNPDFSGIVEHQIEGAVVTELKINTDKVTDVGPIRVFNYLRVLDLSGSEAGGQVNGQLADLSPLKGTNMSRLTRLLLGNTKIDDTGLVHFKDSKNLTHVWLSHTQVSNAGTACFKDCKNLTHLGLKYTRVDDAGLEHFKDCKNLIDLDLGGLPVTDQGMAHFKECKDLTGLWLNSTQVTNAGLAHFQDCKNLASLHVSSTWVSDDGLAHLKGCKKLITVMLDGTRVTDAGLVHFVSRDEMTSLFLMKTKVTEKTVADLAKALPKCKITWDGGVIEPK